MEANDLDNIFVAETRFRRTVAKLKQPNSVKFSEADWRGAFASEQGGSSEDWAFFETAVWVAEQSKGIRTAFQPLRENHLGARFSKVLAVAALNREFNTAAKLLKEQQASHDNHKYASIDYLASLPIQGGVPGNEFSASSFTETAVDAAESWLFDAFLLPTEPVSRPVDIAPIAVRSVQFYSFQHALNDLWNQARWEGWHISQNDIDLRWIPPSKSYAALSEAWRGRQESNFMSHVYGTVSGWIKQTPEERRRAVIKTVLEIRGDRPRRFKFGKPLCLSKRFSNYVGERVGLETSYLEQFYRHPFRLKPRLNCELLIKAWNIIADIARILNRFENQTTSLTVEQAHKLALVVRRSEIHNALSSCLSIDREVVDNILEFFSFEPRRKVDTGHRGLWSAPLVPLGADEAFALALPVLLTSNSLRKVEAWLEKGGLDDSSAKFSRGDSFEAELRKRIQRKIHENTLFNDARCADFEIKRNEDFGEQIDLLVQIGGLLLVGEIKFHLYPADSLERYNHLRKLRAASEQAIRKASAIRSRPDIVAVALGISIERARELRVFPLVVNNQGFGTALSIGGCRITDSRFLCLCLGTGTMTVDAAISSGSGDRVERVLCLYSSQLEAEKRFEGLLSEPPSLMKLLERIVWRTSNFPTVSGQPLSIEFPVLGDLTDDQTSFIESVTEWIQ